MNKLEAQAIIENTGNYEEEEMEEVMKVYDEVVKHIGFEDKRSDKRYIVKFHDIFYYTAEEIQNDKTFDMLFEDFCQGQVEYMEEYFMEEHIEIDDMLHPMYVGHYPTFIVHIPEITSENAAEITMNVYDEFNYQGDVYVNNYIKVVNTLQDLEDNYMEYWIEFLENEAEFRNIPKKYVEETKNNYEKDKERRK